MVSLWRLLALGGAIVAPVTSFQSPNIDLKRQSNSSTSCSPIATVKNGTYRGIRSSQWGQDFFLGIPFAQPPPRFTVARHLDASWTGKRPATTYPKHCIGYGGDNVGYEMSEDCLYLNIVRPLTTRKADMLPVAVWIHGGGLFNGGSADARYNMSFIVQNGMEQGTPFIGVSINYRVHAFGFLFGKEATEGSATNLGFRDQRLALQWIQENIAAFGGDKDKVSIWGESAGAESISAQVLAYNGRDDKLFRAVAAQSGFAGFDSQRYQGGLNATDAHQRIYDALVTNTSCAATVGTAASLACLKVAPLQELNKALNGTAIGPFAPVLDGDFIQSYPSLQFASGNFVKVAALIGCNTDEGAGTASRRPQGANTEDQVRAAAARIFGPHAPANTGKSVDDLVDELMYLYPDIQAVGLPGFHRIPVLLPGDALANVTGLQLRRTAALWGDLWMHYKRRRASVALSEAGIKGFSYRFDVLVNGPSPQSGSGHFQEVAFVFDNTNGYGYAANPFANKPESFKTLAKTMSRAWANFFVSLDPNGAGNVGGVSWPEYDIKAGGGVGRGIVFDVDKNYVEMDSWRAEGINWFIKNALAIFGD